MENKTLLVLETSTFDYTKVESGSNGEYILEGIFSEIDVRNKNNRIYKENELVPHINELCEKVKKRKVMGELDHPKQFDISLQNVSHLIESIQYDKDKKQVIGKIRILDTPNGKIAKALVDSGVPIHISSRAAGVVENNGFVKIKKLFTYDLVADPGFENAELKRVSENFGIDEESSVQIYEFRDPKASILDDEKTNKETETTIINENKSQYITVEDFEAYTEKIKGIFEELKTKIPVKDDSNEKHISNYAGTIAKKVNSLQTYVTELEESIKNLESHNDYIIDCLEQVKSYSEYNAVKTDQAIEYEKELAKKTDQVIEHNKQVVHPMLDGTVEYVKEELATKLDQTIEYIKTILAPKTDQIIGYSKSLSEDVDLRLQYQDKINEYTDNLITHSDYNTTKLEEGLNYIEYLRSEIEKIGNFSELMSNYLKENGISFPGTKIEEKVDDKTTEVEIINESKDDTEDYKNDIQNKLNTLIESAQKQKAENDKLQENLKFLEYVSENKKEEFKSLSEDDQNSLIESYKINKFSSKIEADQIWESTLKTEKKLDWLELIPEKYKSQWENLTESRKDEIKLQASVHRLNTEYQIKNFWETRDLRSNKKTVEPVLEKKENHVDEKLTEYRKHVSEQLKSKFRYNAE